MVHRPSPAECQEALQEWIPLGYYARLKEIGENPEKMRALDEHLRRTEDVYADARLHEIAKRIASSSDPSLDLIVDESIQVPLMEWRQARYDSLVALARKLGVADELEKRGMLKERAFLRPFDQIPSENTTGPFIALIGRYGRSGEEPGL